METAELMEILERGEDSQHQFKTNITNADSLASEFVAFSNGQGGKMFIGVSDDGLISGLTSEDIHRLNQLISNTASQGVQPAINPVTENIKTAQGLVMVVDVPPGINKPYQDRNGAFWVKSGADKRKATSREEIQRLFQKANLLHADELPVVGATIVDLDVEYFGWFFDKKFGTSLEKQKIPLPDTLRNMNLLRDDCLTIGGVLLFAKDPHFKLPAFVVKSCAFDDVNVISNNYTDKREIKGKLDEMFNQTVGFVLANIRHVQGNQGFNSVGIPEIPRAAIEELVVNALVHRDYFISAPIRVFVFRDRVEIISPGHLPNNLAVDNIKSGNSNVRNSVLASYAYHLLPYSGIGSGILRALEAYPKIDFIDDREGNTFKVIIHRGG